MARYTRKTFIEVSDLLEGFSDLIDQFTFEDLVFEFGEMFSADNPNFDFAKFQNACGVKEICLLPELHDLLR